MNYPEIRIEYAWLLSDATSKHLNDFWGDGTPLLSEDEYKSIAKSYRKTWKIYEKRILHALEDILGLRFRHNIIDVYIAPWMNAYSDPMVIGVQYEPSHFVEVLTHELIHRYLDDNNIVSRDDRLLKEWRNMFGNQEFNVTVHIPVHAIMQKIFDDIINEPDRTIHDKKECEQWPEYDAAWKYVDKVGYEKIIKQLKEIYKRLGE